jgi:hypothetical protein
LSMRNRVMRGLDERGRLKAVEMHHEDWQRRQNTSEGGSNDRASALRDSVTIKQVETQEEQ